MLLQIKYSADGRMGWDCVASFAKKYKHNVEYLSETMT